MSGFRTSGGVILQLEVLLLKAPLLRGQLIAAVVVLRHLLKVLHLRDLPPLQESERLRRRQQHRLAAASSGSAPPAAAAPAAAG